MFNYFREVRAELRHVSWPSQRQVIIYTVIVLAVTLITAAYLGLLDYIFDGIIQHFAA